MSENVRAILETSMRAARPLVLVMGLEYPLDDPALKDCEVLTFTNQERLLHAFREVHATILILGDQLTALESSAILSRCQAEVPGNTTANIVISAGSDGYLFQNFIDNDRIFYLSRSPLSASELVALVLAAVYRPSGAMLPGESSSTLPSEVLELCARISWQNDLSTLVSSLTNAVQVLAGAEQSSCLLYNVNEDTLYSTGRRDAVRDESAATGVTGYIARTRTSIRLERLDTDSRYDPGADNPGGDGSVRFLAQPILGPIGTNRTAFLGVLTAVRNSAAAPFTDRDARFMELLAAHGASRMSALLAQSVFQSMLFEQASSLEGGSDLYREEAVEHYLNNREEGNPLQSMPRVLLWSHWLVVVLLLGLFAVMVLVRIDQYAVGPAIIRAREKVVVPVMTTGLVESVDVAPGDRVRTGDVLLRLANVSNSANDGEAQLLRAPIDGLVSDVKAQRGQHLNLGDQAVGLIREGYGYEVIAFLPGAFAPQLKPGLDLVIKLVGYSDSRQTVTIGSVNNDIVGPRDAERYLGKEGEEAISLSGPIVIARSKLSNPFFTSGGRALLFKDGMTGVAEVSVRSERVIFAVIPALKSIVSDD